MHVSFPSSPVLGQPIPSVKWGLPKSEQVTVELLPEEISWVPAFTRNVLCDLGFN